MAKEDELYQEALKRGSAAGRTLQVRSGGGNVTKSSARWSPLPANSACARKRCRHAQAGQDVDGKSVDDLGHKYEKMVPDYQVKEALMRTYSVHVRLRLHPAPGPRSDQLLLSPGIRHRRPAGDGRGAQGRGGRAADGDGTNGNQPPVQLRSGQPVGGRPQELDQNYAKEARRLEGLEKDAVQKREYAQIGRAPGMGRP